MALRWFADFKDENNHTWRVEIYDRQFLGVAKEIRLAGRDGVVVTWRTSEDWASLMPSRCEVQAYADAHFEFWDIAGRDWGEVTCTIKLNNTNWWSGILNTEAFREAYIDTPYVSRLVFDDGLVAGRHLPFGQVFNSQVESGSPRTVFGILAAFEEWRRSFGLPEADIVEFFDVQYREGTNPGRVATLRSLYVWPEWLQLYDESLEECTEVEILKVLGDILQALGFRLIFWKNRWHVLHYSLLERATSQPLAGRVYSFRGAAVNVTTQNFDLRATIGKVSGQWRLRRVLVDDSATANEAVRVLVHSYDIGAHRRRYLGDQSLVLNGQIELDDTGVAWGWKPVNLEAGVDYYYAVAKTEGMEGAIVLKSELDRLTQAPFLTKYFINGCPAKRFKVWMTPLQSTQGMTLNLRCYLFTPPLYKFLPGFNPATDRLTYIAPIEVVLHGTNTYTLWFDLGRGANTAVWDTRNWTLTSTLLHFQALDPELSVWRVEVEDLAITWPPQVPPAIGRYEVEVKIYKPNDNGVLFNQYPTPFGHEFAVDILEVKLAGVEKQEKRQVFKLKSATKGESRRARVEEINVSYGVGFGEGAPGEFLLYETAAFTGRLTTDYFSAGRFEWQYGWETSNWRKFNQVMLYDWYYSLFMRKLYMTLEGTLYDTLNDLHEFKFVFRDENRWFAPRELSFDLSGQMVKSELFEVAQIRVITPPSVPPRPPRGGKVDIDKRFKQTREILSRRIADVIRHVEVDVLPQSPFTTEKTLLPNVAIVDVLKPRTAGSYKYKKQDRRRVEAALFSMVEKLAQGEFLEHAQAAQRTVMFNKLEESGQVKLTESGQTKQTEDANAENRSIESRRLTDVGTLEGYDESFLRLLNFSLINARYRRRLA